MPGRAAGRTRGYYFLVPPAVLLPILVGCLDPPIRAIRRGSVTWEPDQAVYAGASSCRKCHAEITDLQVASNHALTIRDLKREPPRARFGNGDVVVDPLTGGRYTTDPGSRGRPQVRLSVGSQETRQDLDYEFGSGVHAFGYLARVGEGEWFDCRLNYYARHGAWDFTSSQDKPNAYLVHQPLGRPQSEEKVAQCFSCHSTVLRVQGRGSELDGKAVRLRPDASDLGVHCEACHGPRADHVQARTEGRSEAKRRPRSADELNILCGRCHGLNTVSDAHPVIARFQPRGLDQSRCFRASAGRLSCLTCHDPHDNARRESRFYEAKCLDCHSRKPDSVGRTVCPVNRATGCVGCHMPVDSRSMIHTSFTDHRIRIVRNRVQDGSRSSSPGRPAQGRSAHDF